MHLTARVEPTAVLAFIEVDLNKYAR